MSPSDIATELCFTQRGALFVTRFVAVLPSGHGTFARNRGNPPLGTVFQSNKQGERNDFLPAGLFSIAPQPRISLINQLWVPGGAEGFSRGEEIWVEGSGYRTSYRRMQTPVCVFRRSPVAAPTTSKCQERLPGSPTVPTHGEGRRRGRVPDQDVLATP